MKKFLLMTVAIAATGAALPAAAADFGYRSPYQKAPIYPALIYDWNGFYVGAHVGGAFSSDNNFNGLGTGNNGNGRVLGGLQVGGDWQFNPNWVVGVEGQYSWLSGNVGAVFPVALPTPTTSAGSARSRAASATPGVRACSM